MATKHASYTLDSLEESAKNCTMLTDNLRSNIGVPNTLMFNLEAGNLVTSIQSELSELEEAFKQLHKLAVDRHAHLCTVESLHENAENFRNRTQTCLENLPSCRPSEQLPTAKNNTSGGGAGGKSSTPMYRSSQGRFLETPCVEANENVSHAETPMMPSCSELRKKGPALFMPTVEYLTDREFEAVPKYMKGRITCKQINTAVDELNKAVDAKYLLMKTSKSQMTEAVRKTIRIYKDQERKETSGLHFVVGSDLTNFSRFRLDRAGQSILVILRHCARIREVRGGGHTRYCVC